MGNAKSYEHRRKPNQLCITSKGKKRPLVVRLQVKACAVGLRIRRFTKALVRASR